MRKLITTDSHMVPPPWLVNEVPERLRPHIPDLFMHVEEIDGERYIVIPQQRAMAIAEASAADAGEAIKIKVESEEHLIQQINMLRGVDAMPHWDPVGRLIDMQRENVVGAVLITNIPLSLERGPLVVEAQTAWCRTVNDWLHDTYKDHYDQFAAGIYLPFFDPAECVKELERCAALGMRPALLPDAIWGSPYYGAEWEPFWEAAAGLRIPVTMHIAGTRNKLHPDTNAGSHPLFNPAYAGAGIAGFYSQSVQIGITLVDLTFSGIFQKYPDLQVIVTEGYAFWLAGLMDFCDHHWQGRFGEMGRQMIELDALPSHYMKRQAHATFMWDPVAIHNRSFTGTDSLLWGNDYPHREGIFPDSQPLIEKQFAGVPEAEIEKMTYSNAKELFGFGDVEFGDA
jgi:predicted TIM-barrel fold metal-dependent hydrolase